MQVPAPTSFDRHEAIPTDRRLTPLERRVVLLGRDDAGRPAAGRRGFARLLQRLTGIEPPQPLADSRLEALRRYASLIRRGDLRGDEIAAELTRFGFSPEALAEATAITRS